MVKSHEKRWGCECTAKQNGDLNTVKCKIFCGFWNQNGGTRTLGFSSGNLIQYLNISLYLMQPLSSFYFNATWKNAQLQTHTWYLLIYCLICHSPLNTQSELRLIKIQSVVSCCRTDNVNWHPAHKNAEQKALPNYYCRWCSHFSWVSGSLSSLTLGGRGFNPVIATAKKNKKVPADFRVQPISQGMQSEMQRTGFTSFRMWQSEGH